MNIFKFVIVLTTSMIVSLPVFSSENDTTIIGDVEMPEVQHSNAFNQVKKMIG